jgi:hypothetical protein
MSEDLKQMHLMREDENGITLDYYNLRAPAVLQLQQVNTCRRMAKYGGNIERILILNLFPI